MERKFKMSLRGAFFLAGVTFGTVSEINTNVVAGEKIKTVEACEIVAPIETVITPRFNECIASGNYGVKIDKDKLPPNKPAQYVDFYKEQQQKERGMEYGRLVIYGLVFAIPEVTISGTLERT